MAFAQDIVVSFTGVNANGGYQRLDSVAIHNYSQSWDRTAIYPDTVMIASVTGIENHSIDNYMLSPNVPNPFDGHTEFELSVYEAGNVSVSVCDLAGRTRTFADTDSNTVRMDLSELAAGIYFVRVQTEAGTVTKRVVKR